MAEGENKQNCESKVVLSRENSQVYQGKRELISIRDMFLTKKWPLDKIKGIIAKNKGIPDEDAPENELLTQYWVYTSKSQTEEEASRQRSETTIAADTTGAGVGALMACNMGPRGSVQVSQDALQQLAASTEPPSGA